MPDPERKTISATQVPALYNASPYLTRFMLYHYLRGAPLERAATGRMTWGKRMQPLVLDQAQTDLKLEITANFAERYVKSDHGFIGCTVDATTVCPDRGPGVVEAKCVFDFGVWMRDWGGGNQVPKQYELQLQTQLLVGNGSSPFGWGVIAAWVCGEMHYFERRRDDAVSCSIIEQAVDMLTDVTRGKEPEPFAPALELPVVNKLFPPVKGKELDLRSDPAAQQWAQLARDYKDWKASENFYGKAAEDGRARLRTLARDNAVVLLPDGVTLKITERERKAYSVPAGSYTTVGVSIVTGAEEAEAQELPDGSPI